MNLEFQIIEVDRDKNTRTHCWSTETAERAFQSIEDCFSTLDKVLGEDSIFKIYFEVVVIPLKSERPVFLESEFDPK